MADDVMLIKFVIRAKYRIVLDYIEQINLAIVTDREVVPDFIERKDFYAVIYDNI